MLPYILLKVDLTAIPLQFFLLVLSPFLNIEVIHSDFHPSWEIKGKKFRGMLKLLKDLSKIVTHSRTKKITNRKELSNSNKNWCVTTQ